MADDLLQANLEEVAKEFDRGITHTRKIFAAVLNDATDEVWSSAVEEVIGEVNLDKAYVQKHLFIHKRASAKKLQTVIRGTVRGVLLSRYGAQQVTRAGKGRSQVKAGISVKIKPTGRRITMASAFFIRLKRGKAAGEGALGVAIRPKPGMKLSRRESLEVNKRGYAVLHGPSVDQVWRSISASVEPDYPRLTELFFERMSRYE